MPSYTINQEIERTATPPISDVQSWVAGRVFPTNMPLLDVSQAVPSYSPAHRLREHLMEVLNEPPTSIYTDIVGLPALREALAGHLSEDYVGDIDASQIAITAGCNQAFSVATDILTEPGDEVLLPVPYYFNHQMWLEMRSLRPVFIHRAGSTLSASDFETHVTERTRALVLVNPDNPTGTEYSAEFISCLFEFCSSRGIALVIDETYKDFRSQPEPPHTLFQRPDWDQHFVHLYSFSKAYAVTGYRIGAIAAHPSLIAAAEKLLDCATICASHLSQRAALFALTHLDGWKREKAAMMRERVDVLQKCFMANELRYELVSSGAYFAYVKHPFEDQDATTVARRLADEFNILCLPGSMFGDHQERFLRFAFANLEADQIPELVGRLVASQD